MDTAPLRVAIIGCHRMLDRIRAPHNLAAALQAVPGLTVVAVQDRSESVRERFLSTWREVWPAATAYAEIDALLRSARTDMVVVANSPAHHATVVEAAVAAGARGILLDKPMATTLAECDRIHQACRGARVAFALALDRRWSPLGAQLRRELSQGVIGVVQGVTLSGVPELVNHGCHWFDVALSCCGDAEPVWAMGALEEPIDARSRLDPPGRGLVGLRTGEVITVATGGGAPVPAVEIQGSAGRLLVLNWYLREQPAEAWLLPGALGEPRAGTRLRRLELGAADPAWPHGPRMVADLFARIADGGTTACDSAQARRATECGFALHASSLQGGARVEIPLASVPTRESLRVPGPPWGSDAPEVALAGAGR